MSGSPSAIEVTPSKVYLGDDGSWSTFEIGVGNPPQQVYVVPSTLVPVTWVVSTEACGTGDPVNCNELRGNLFDTTKSTSWKEVNKLTLGVETTLGWAEDEGGDFGFDSVILDGAQGAVPVDQTVVAAITATDSYVGVLGLAARNATLQGKTANETAPSLLSSLRTSSRIPSLSYSYTAGAFYNNTLASLVLGGFDASRVKPNGVSFDFGPDQSEYLNVGIQGMSFTGPDGKTSSLLSDPITANIDSTVSAFWLPNDTCTAIANSYGLTFDSLHQLYTINSTQHDLNLKNNPQASFQLGNTVAGGPSVSINLPYAAFDMNFTNPNSAQAQPLKIFPLKQATGANQYTLGRAFLQEAVLTVDFERSNFSLAQAISVPAGTAAQIVNIISPTDTSSSNGGGTSTSSPSNPSSTGVTPVVPSSSSSSSPSFPTGAIAGIVIAVIAIIAAVFGFLWFRRRKAKKHPSAPAVLTTDSQMEAAQAKRPLVPELAEKSPGYDHYTHPDAKPAPAYNVSESEIHPAEIDSPQLEGTTFPPIVQHITPGTLQELPAGKDPIGSELHSRSASIGSAAALSALPPAGFAYTSLSRGSPSQSRAESPSADANRFSSPTAASGAEGNWAGSYMAPSSPESAKSVNIRAVRGAHIVNSVSPRSPQHTSRQGSVDNTGMSATIGSTGVHGLGVFSGHDELQRKNSQRSSQSTLVGGPSGRVSPEAGVGTNTYTNLSAFASPELIPIQRPSVGRQDSAPDHPFLVDDSPVEHSPSDVDEERR